MVTINSPSRPLPYPLLPPIAQPEHADDRLQVLDDAFTGWAVQGDERADGPHERAAVVVKPQIFSIFGGSAEPRVGPRHRVDERRCEEEPVHRAALLKYCGHCVRSTDVSAQERLERRVEVHRDHLNEGESRRKSHEDDYQVPAPLDQQ